MNTLLNLKIDILESSFCHWATQAINSGTSELLMLLITISNVKLEK